MADRGTREALRDKVQRERRAEAGVPEARDDTTVEIVRDGPADPERLWDKPRGGSGVGAWIAVTVVFAASVAAAFVVGFAAMYAYEAMK